jgi:hypothetical protein
MSSQTLNASASMKCPHGGTVSAVPTESSVKVGSAAPLKMTDTFTISGCQFKIPAGPAQIPSPCTSVIWVKPDMWVLAGMTPTLSKSSIGLCIGLVGVQGKVLISAAGQSVTKTT